MNNSTEADNKAPEDIQFRKPERNKKKKIIGIVVFVILNAVVLYFTAKADFSKEVPEYTGEPFGLKNVLFMIGALCCVAAVLMAETVKYLLMMKHLGEKVSFRNAFETAALGKYYDNITPSGAGGQPFQIWHLHSKGYSAGAASAMPLTGFVTMQFGFVFLALIIFVFGEGSTDTLPIKIAAYVGAVFYMIAPVMIVIAAISPRTAAGIASFFVRAASKIRLLKNPETKIEKTKAALEDYSRSLKKIASNRRLLISLFLLSVVFHVAMCSLPYFVLHIFGENIGFFRALSMCVFVYAAITIVPTPGNSGAAEGSFYILFSRLDTSGLFFAMLLWRFLCYYMFIIIGLGVYGYGSLEKLLKKKRGDHS